MVRQFALSMVQADLCFLQTYEQSEYFLRSFLIISVYIFPAWLPPQPDAIPRMLKKSIEMVVPPILTYVLKFIN